jgi:hypothetical protein
MQPLVHTAAKANFVRVPDIAIVRLLDEQKQLEKE